MSAAKAHVLMIKGAISELSEEEQMAVAFCANEFCGILERGEAAAAIALALVTAEIAAKEESV